MSLSVKVGAVLLAPTVAEALSTLANVCSSSMRTRPPAFICGVTFRMTPVSAYWIVLKTEFDKVPVSVVAYEPVGTGTLPPTVMVASMLSVASSVGVESTVTLVLDGQGAQKHRQVLCGSDPGQAEPCSRNGAYIKRKRAG